MRVSVRNNKGFSLIELMVVVAIIGVLAAIAVPNVNKYIAKSRQSEAKTNLSSIYTSEKAFFAEYSAYHNMFGAIGYSPEGKLRYNVGFAAATAVATGANGYSNPPGAAPGNTASTLAYCGTAAAMPNGCMLLNGADNSAPPALTSGDVDSGAAGGPIFTVQALAVVFSTAKDEWTINQNKDLQNKTPGIN